MKRLRKGFTLIEVLVSLVIISLLVIVIFQTYKSIADISVRVNNVYKLTNELLFAHQTIQNMVDVGQLDMDKYIGPDGTNKLEATNGLTDTIYFKGVNGYNVKIFFDKNCKADQPDVGCLKLAKRKESAPENETEPDITDKIKNVPLTDPQLAIINSGFTFILQPIKNVKPPADTTNSDGKFFVGSIRYNNKEDIKHPGFWMHGTMKFNISPIRPKMYQVSMPIQSFFNFRSY